MNRCRGEITAALGAATGLYGAIKSNPQAFINLGGTLLRYQAGVLGALEFIAEVIALATSPEWLLLCSLVLTLYSTTVIVQNCAGVQGSGIPAP